MVTAERNGKFTDNLLITLTNEERRYLGLASINPEWDTSVYHSKTNFWYTRVTAFFDGNTIVKVISESKRILEDGTENHSSYTEYDTNLTTSDRKQLLPLTSRGKPKPLSASNINAVTPFGCELSIIFDYGKDTILRLANLRANKFFPIGEHDAVSSIGSEADFHAFMKDYIDTCENDYFDKLQAFKSAKKVTVKYKVGDIFRMELDRTHYCYGIITGDIKKLKAMTELPQKHSLRQLMTVPIMVRLYQLITKDPNLKADDLRHVTLGRMEIAADNNIIWGTHTIVDHKHITSDDLEFHFICKKMISHSSHITLSAQDMFINDGLIPKNEYMLYIEWGFAQTTLRYDQLSDKLKKMLLNYKSPHGGVALSIDPQMAVPDEKHRQYHFYRYNLLNSDNREILNEIFACLGLNEDATFDEFAKRFGGLTLQEIVSRMK